MCPIVVRNLVLYTDSMIALNWLDNSINKLSKSQNKLNVFVRNRLYSIEKLCEHQTVTFNFIPGDINPADQVTRAVSAKVLKKTNFYTGPTIVTSPKLLPNPLSVVIPCPKFTVNSMVTCRGGGSTMNISEIVPSNKYSSFSKLVNVLAYVLKFVDKLKNAKYEHANYFTKAKVEIIKNDQALHFEDCINYFSSKNVKISSMPNLVKQLNVFLDQEGILRVGSKFRRKSLNYDMQPILLHRSSIIADLVIRSLHVRMGHSGKYVVLAQLRKEFYIPKIFSKVKTVLGNCTLCKRLNSRPIELNQSDYRLERLDPPTVPFRSIYIDHFGPYCVKLSGTKVKVYLLLFTCMFTRAFNVQICLDMTVESFLRAFQLHVHKYGLPSRITSDPGSTLVAGGNIIKTFLNDESVLTYLTQHDIRGIEFTQFCKGNSSLGSLVESGVKLFKKLIFSLEYMFVICCFCSVVFSLFKCIESLIKSL